MPNVKSAAKRARQSEGRRAANRRHRSRLRTAIKKVRQAADPAAAEQSLSETVSLLDWSARKGLIHPNKAARDKSRLTRAARQLREKVVS